MTKHKTLLRLLGSLSMTLIASILVINALGVDVTRAIVFSHLRASLNDSFQVVATFGELWMPHTFWQKDVEVFVFSPTSKTTAESSSSSIYQVQRYYLRKPLSYDLDIDKTTDLIFTEVSSQAVDEGGSAQIQHRLLFTQLAFTAGQYIVVLSLFPGLIAVIQSLRHREKLKSLQLQAALVVTSITVFAISRLIAFFII